MRHDPSTYIGIGENGFRGPDPYDPFYDESEPDLSSRKSTSKNRDKTHGKPLIPALVILLVASMLGYFFIKG